MKTNLLHLVPVRPRPATEPGYHFETAMTFHRLYRDFRVTVTGRATLNEQDGRIEIGLVDAFDEFGRQFHFQGNEESRAIDALVTEFERED